jgi:hypothetical protein
MIQKYVKINFFFKFIFICYIVLVFDFRVLFFLIQSNICASDEHEWVELLCITLIRLWWLPNYWQVPSRGRLAIEPCHRLGRPYGGMFALCWRVLSRLCDSPQSNISPCLVKCLVDVIHNKYWIHFSNIISTY